MSLIVTLVLPLLVGLALLKWWVLPNANLHKNRLEQLVSQVIIQPVAIERLAGQWQGLSPQLELFGVRVGSGATSFVSERIRVQFSLARWLRLNPNSSNIEIDGMTLSLERNARGQWCMLGHCFAHDDNNPSAGLKTLLQQKRVLVRNAHLQVKLASQQQPISVQLNEALLHNGLVRHQAAAQFFVNLSDNVQGISFEFKTDFKTPIWKPNSSLIADWQGQAYAAVQLPNAALLKALPNATEALNALGIKGVQTQYLSIQWPNATLRAWAQFAKAQVHHLSVQLKTPEFSSSLPMHDVSLRNVDVFFELAGEKNILHPNRVKLHHAQAQHMTTSGLMPIKLGLMQVWRDAKTDAHYGIEMKSQQLQHVLQVWRMVLPALRPMLKEHEAAIPKWLVPLVDPQLLPSITLNGHIQQLKLEWLQPSASSLNHPKATSVEQTAKQLPTFKLNVDAEQLAVLWPVSSEHAINGLKGIDVNVSGDHNQGRWRINKHRNQKDLALFMPMVFHQPEQRWQQFTAKGRWAKTSANDRPDGWQLVIEQFLAKNADLTTGLQGSVQMPWPFKRGQVDLQGNITQASLQAVANYLPKVVGEKTHAWLTQALLGGEAQHGTWQLKGDLSSFPFTKGEGVFKVRVPFSKGQLQFASTWPVIQGISGVAEFSGVQMQIKARQANTMNVPLHTVTATIPDLRSPEPLLDVEGTAEGALPNMLAYAQSSPLESLSAAFVNSYAEGNAHLNLRLSIPLHDVNHPKVNGLLQLSNNRFQITPGMPMVSQLSGAVHFTEHTLSFKGLKGEAMGGELTVNGTTQPDGALMVNAEGLAHSQGVGDYLRTTLGQWPTNWLSGQTKYQVQVLAQKNKAIKLDVHTNLQGMAIALPAPLGKSALETMALHVQQTLDPKDERIHIELGEDGRIAQARMLVQHTENRRVIEGMQLAMGAALPPPAKGTQGELRMPALNINTWRTVLADVQAPSPSSTQASSIVNASNPLLPLPVRVRLRSEETQWSGRKFETLSLTARTNEKRWQFDVQGKGIDGYLQFSSDASRPEGTVLARFKQLSIPKGEPKAKGQVVEEPTKTLPALDILVDDFTFNDKDWGRLLLKAVNQPSTSTTSLANAARSWRIQALRIENSESTLDAQGAWHYTPGTALQHTELELEHTVQDAGALLRRLGFKDVFKGGKAGIQAKLRWHASPDDFDWATLSGQLNITSRNGQFLKADPGVAKLLGVLSLQSIPRRLTLDFKDLFSAGFAYDTLDADVTLNQGVASTRSLKMVAPSATVLMEGQFDLSKETQLLNVVVLPDLNATAGSLLYSILAANPAVGLASLLADYWLKDPISKVFSVQYQVSGSWHQPIVERTNVKPNRTQP